MSLKPRLKCEVNFYRRKKVKEYDLAGISRSAFLNALGGKPCEVVTIHRTLDILAVPESERRGLIVWE